MIRCGFIQFSSTEAVDKAILMNGTDLLGRKIRLDFSESKNKPGAPRGGGGGGKFGSPRGGGGGGRFGGGGRGGRGGGGRGGFSPRGPVGSGGAPRVTKFD